MLGNIISGFVIVLVGVIIAPTVANSVTSAGSNGTFNTTAGWFPNTNFTNGSAPVLSLVTLFFVLAVTVAAMNVGIVGLRQAGLLI